jgi:carbamoyltransferase
MEWGPRALGNRSIIADPRPKDFREKINKEIKRRPAFQPFCPSILAEEAPRLFESYYLNKHMTCAFRMKKEFWDKLPSAIHIDGTARAQFVSREDNEKYYRLLKKVKDLTGFGIIINTSFNKHGRTIVETPHDAIIDFLDTDMDYVVIEGLLITRKK